MTMRSTSQFWHIILLGLLIGLILYCIGLVAGYVIDNEPAQFLVQQYGVLGVLIISFIAGLNLIVPVPAAAFVPIFTSSGLGLLTIITFLIIGTMLADLLAYSLGRLGQYSTAVHSQLQEKIAHTYTTHRRLLPYLVFGFAGFIPIPNEIWLIPLGFLGIPLRVFIVPLLAGTIMYQTLAANGVQAIFEFIL